MNLKENYPYFCHASVQLQCLYLIIQLTLYVPHYKHRFYNDRMRNINIYTHISSPPLKSFLLHRRSRPAYWGVAVGRQRRLFLQSGHRRRSGGKERGSAGAPCAW